MDPESIPKTPQQIANKKYYEKNKQVIIPKNVVRNKERYQVVKDTQEHKDKKKEYNSKYYQKIKNNRIKEKEDKLSSV